MFKKLVDAFYNPVEHALKKQPKNILVIWNRGLGDIPLGLCAFVHRAKEIVPKCEITFATRPDLADLFKMIPNVNVLVCSNMKRGEPIPELPLEPYDLVLDTLNPTRHLKWQLGTFTPRLTWDKGNDVLADAFNLDPKQEYIAAHVHTETGQYYGYEKNWDKWQSLFEKVDKPVILFGMKPDNAFAGCIDLRGKTSLFGMLSIIKNRCPYLVAPDSGILSVLYYLDVSFPCRVVSLWSDPRQGVLRQKVDSPNPELEHIPLISKKLSDLSVEKVYEALFAKPD